MTFVVPCAVFFLVVLLTWPTGACACVEESEGLVLLQIMLFLVYLFVFPVVLFALGGRTKHLVPYFILLILSCISWMYWENLFYVVPVLPFIGLIWHLRSTHYKFIK